MSAEHFDVVIVGGGMVGASLLDVVGIDTGAHAGQVMAEGFPDRMTLDFKTVTEEQ